MASGDSVAWRFQTEHAAFGSFPNVPCSIQSRVAFALHAISANELAIIATFIMHDLVKVLSRRPPSKLIFEIAVHRDQNFPFLLNFQVVEMPVEQRVEQRVKAVCSRSAGRRRYPSSSRCPIFNIPWLRLVVPFTPVPARCANQINRAFVCALRPRAVLLAVPTGHQVTCCASICSSIRPPLVFEWPSDRIRNRYHQRWVSMTFHQSFIFGEQIIAVYGRDDYSA